MSVFYTNVKLKNFIIHHIENKESGKPIILSNKKIEIKDDHLKSMLIEYFFSSLKKDKYFHFVHNTDLKMNEIFFYTKNIFKSGDSFSSNSIDIANHLYDCSVHPNIKNGQVFIAHFNNCIIDEFVTDAIGIFKIENQDYFLKTKQINNQVDIDYEQGIDLDKIDKGCLIFNIEEENGYVVSVIDNINKGFEARYWTQDFLHVEPRKDEYYNTQNVMSLCKDFVTQALPQSITKADQVDILNKSVKYFKENESFDMSAFSNEVITNPDLIEIFNRYKSEFELAREIAILENFSISESAVKKQARSIKSVIKLDKNFHIYVHGSKDLIQQGTEEDGRKYYKIYYNEEN